ncbi:hypothetical protein GCM10023150_07030 [Kangiella taiwanensis]|uniref:Uncharacterized protein n=1 Tax=Kangiella taiwanensis TaxID=1079179 RepID=A0ABP8HWC2_9GAMM
MSNLLERGEPEGPNVGGVFSFRPFLWTSKEKGKILWQKNLTHKPLTSELRQGAANQHKNAERTEVREHIRILF